MNSRLLSSTCITFSAVTSEAPSEVAPSWTALPGGVIDGGEIVLLAIKPSMWRLLFDSAPWLTMCVMLATLLVGLGRSLPGLSLYGTAQLILLIGFARVGVAIVRWIPTWHVLTNRRIIDIQGVRTPRTTHCHLMEIRNTVMQVSSAEKLTRLGTIVFVTEHPDQAPRMWKSIAKPEVVHAKIRRAIENAIDQHHVT